jgi:LuxR family maltose regulon positive regulatory protein
VRGCCMPVAKLRALDEVRQGLQRLQGLSGQRLYAVRARLTLVRRLSAAAAPAAWPGARTLACGAQHDLP